MLMKPYRQVVANILNELRPANILDAPSGNGWLASLLKFDASIDGLDLFAHPPAGYRYFENADLDMGLPDNLRLYEAIVCCEGIEHFGNPDVFLKTVCIHLVSKGVVIITTPNIWFPAAKLTFLVKGFFPSFPSLVGNISRGNHMHIMPWSYPHLFLFLKLNGFENIALHDVNEKKPKRIYEYILGLPQRLYCFQKRKNASTQEERDFWTTAGSKQSVYGRRLVVSATKP